ncbi:MAG: 3-hydroxyanthranilate 3,4-dioxygenase [Phycisphaerae bacterium]
MALAAFGLKNWIDEHRHLLKPPVGNQCMFADKDFIVMIVGGPNARKDFHINETEEFFYQIEGDITLRIREDGKVRDIPIREGEVFMLPANIPHSPQRPANTVGMVVERQRPAGMKDHVRFYCEACDEVVKDYTFDLTDIVNQLKSIMESYWSDEQARTCKKCGAVMRKPAAVPA